ncbi:hypothetical protein BJ322DRAFT_1020505 [Thelephora terrestris]|uniref:Uncharacterized protein n=1 Tax=Thelephora terrestris TaxID=56493 RepID=A0A9P6HHU1_9AGAM|nr:hypothetical protein BJ322DRAFT_1020505 [Thelephora terrestris]
MSTKLYSYWLLRRDGDSYTSKGRYSHSFFPYASVEALVQVARSHIPPEDAQLGGLSIEVHGLDGALSPREFRAKLAKVITPENRFYPHETMAEISHPENLIVFYTYAPINICFAIFQKKATSYTYFTHDSLTGLHTQNVAVIEAAVRVRLRALLQDGDLTGAFEVAVWDLRYNLTHSSRVIDISKPHVSILPDTKKPESANTLRQLLKETEQTFNDAYFRTQCDRLIWSDELTRISNTQSLIVIASERHEVCFDFGVFRRTSTSFQYIEHGYYKGRSCDTVQTIENAARECIGLRYEASDIGDICVYEPQISYAEAYNAPLGNLGNLSPDSDKLRTSALQLLATRRLWEIDSKVLIVVFGGDTIPDAKIRFTYALFNRTLTSLDYVSQSFVKLSSGRTVKSILTAARGMMNTISEDHAPKSFEVRVYRTMEGFEEAMKNTFYGILKLDEDHERNHKWDPARHPFLPPESPLLDLDPTQNLLVIFFPPLPANIAENVG